MDVLFGSDNMAGASPEVIETMFRDKRKQTAYGDDFLTPRVNEAYSALFERDVTVYSTTSGTAANALGLAAITPPFGEIICHQSAHILTTEAGAPEFFAGGARLVGIPGAFGKIVAAELETFLDHRMKASKHHMRCSALSLTQATEAGTCYSTDELEALCDVAHERGLRVHMDGARFANAVAALGVSPAELTWKCGVDILSYGTSKNGTLNAEAVICFDKALARDLAIMHKRAGFLTAKMRYLSAQHLAMIENDLWLKNASHANEIALAIESIFRRTPGVELVHPVETNQLFVRFSASVKSALSDAGIGFRTWSNDGSPIHRLVTSFEDDMISVRRVDDALESAA